MIPTPATYDCNYMKGQEQNHSDPKPWITSDLLTGQGYHESLPTFKRKGTQTPPPQPGARRATSYCNNVEWDI